MRPKQPFKLDADGLPRALKGFGLAPVFEALAGYGTTWHLAADPIAADFVATGPGPAPPYPATAHNAVRAGMPVPLLAPPGVAMHAPFRMAVVAEPVPVNDAPVDWRSGRYR